MVEISDESYKVRENPVEISDECPSIKFFGAIWS